MEEKVMTKEQIEQGNKLIAEFMGFNLNKKSTINRFWCSISHKLSLQYCA
jgi:hypothetical protein